MRALLLAATLALVLSLPAASAATLPEAPAALDEECGGTVALLCEHDPSTPNGTICIVYVRGGCIIWM